MRLNQVMVPSLDVARAVAFYKRLGLTQIVDSLPDYARFVCPEGGSTFSIERVDALPRGPGVQVCFECDDLDERCARLAGEGVAFDSGPADRPWAWREAELRDPDGNRLCLFHAGENRVDPPWRIDAGAS